MYKQQWSLSLYSLYTGPKETHFIGYFILRSHTHIFIAVLTFKSHTLSVSPTASLSHHTLLVLSHFLLAEKHKKMRNTICKKVTVPTCADSSKQLPQPGDSLKQWVEFGFITCHLKYLTGVWARQARDNTYCVKYLYSFFFFFNFLLNMLN